MAKVIAKCQIQRTNPETGDREMIKAGTVFESTGKELEELRSIQAVGEAKGSDALKAEEDGLEPIIRKNRLRSRKEMRAIREAEDFDTKKKGTAPDKFFAADDESGGNKSENTDPKSDKAKTGKKGRDLV